jgi:hypothetical protein
MSKAVVYTGWAGIWDQFDTGVTDVTVADGMAEVQEAAFAGCKGLTNLSFLEDSAITTVGHMRFTARASPPCRGWRA